MSALLIPPSTKYSLKSGNQIASALEPVAQSGERSPPQRSDSPTGLLSLIFAFFSFFISETCFLVILPMFLRKFFRLVFLLIFVFVLLLFLL